MIYRIIMLNSIKNHPDCDLCGLTYMANGTVGLLHPAPLDWHAIVNGLLGSGDIVVNGAGYTLTSAGLERLELGRASVAWINSSFQLEDV